MTHTRNGPDCTCPNDDHHDRLVEAEIERLRAALLRTADAPCSHCGYTGAHGERNTAHFIADQALAIGR